MPSNELSDVTVIGAGVIGLCCALLLQRAGLSVTLIDKGQPGNQASFGHAGVMGVPYCLPAASLAALRALPRMATDPNSPMVIRLRALPTLVPWFAQFALSARAGRVMQNIAAAAELQRTARADWEQLLSLTDASRLLRWMGMLEVCESEASLAHAHTNWRIMRDHGFQVQVFSGEQVRDLEPALSARVVGGALLADAGHTVDPAELSRALHAAFIFSRGKFVLDEVRKITPIEEIKCNINCETRSIVTTKVVIAAGISSRGLADSFGNHVSVAAERGYHIMFGGTGLELRRPITAVDRKVVMCSMTSGLRMTSMAEFTSPDARPDHPRALRVFSRALPLLPALEPEISSRWVGSRPSTPDSLPVICRSPKHRSVFFAFGHGSRGLTLAATTARLVAALVLEKQIATDMRPLSSERF